MTSGQKNLLFKSLAVMGSIYPAYKLFTLSTGLAAAIASIPVMKTINQLVELPPVTSKIAGFLVIGAMLVVSWYVAEAVMVLAAIAIAGEVCDLINKIKEAHAARPEVEKARKHFNVYGRPYFAAVEG